MSTSASSLVLPTFTFNSQSLCSSKQALSSAYCQSSLSLKLISKPISLSASFLHLDRACASLPSRFVRKFSLSSDLFQEEGILSDGDLPSYSPDLKLFVGNLPFSLDSSQLAQLFESVGRVEMVEVYFSHCSNHFYWVHKFHLFFFFKRIILVMHV